MFSKDKCRDMFRDIDQLDQIKPTKELVSSYVKSKVQIGIKERQLKKIITMSCYGMFKGRNYIVAQLKKIQLVKDLFMIQINQGKEIGIPLQLS